MEKNLEYPMRFNLLRCASGPSEMIRSRIHLNSLNGRRVCSKSRLIAVVILKLTDSEKKVFCSHEPFCFKEQPNLRCLLSNSSRCLLIFTLCLFHKFYNCINSNVLNYLSQNLN